MDAHRGRVDVENETDKGFYNASDLNRVGAAVEYIAGRFAALGYDCPVTVKKDWLTSDAPTAALQAIPISAANIGSRTSPFE